MSTRIKEIREKLGMSQEKFAKSIGVTRWAVMEWEQGRSKPTADNVVKMSAISGETSDYILGISES